MKAVYKYPLKIDDYQQVILPMGAKILCIKVQNGTPCLWALIDKEQTYDGVGRLMSRAMAKSVLDMQDFKDSMSGIYTTSINESTIDEAPMAYKPMDEIVECIGDAVNIISTIKPVYNFKAAE